MKKLLAILVCFAFLASSAQAQRVTDFDAIKLYTFKNKFTSLCPPLVSSTLSLIENLISIAGLVTGFFCCSVVPPASYEQGDGPILPPPLPCQAGGQNQNNMKKAFNKTSPTGNTGKHRGMGDTTVKSAEIMHSSNDDYHLYKNQQSTHTLIHQIQPSGTTGNIYICALDEQSPSLSPASPLLPASLLLQSQLLSNRVTRNQSTHTQLQQ